jgi:ubiquinone/menaquinone biosynthesis C-methylase UbiE
VAVRIEAELRQPFSNGINSEAPGMATDNKTDFDKMAAEWDANPLRVKLANDVADSIIREIRPTHDMDALDYGCGTGLVTLQLAPLVKSVTGVDSSSGMLEVIQGKVKSRGLRNVHTQFVDFEHDGEVEGKFQLAVSSMTMHHVQDTADFLQRLYDLLTPGGTIGVADLEKEDGVFHDDNKGVLHFGFERGSLKGLFEKTGFRDLRDVTATTVVKGIEGQAKREYPVFLIIGRK